MGQFNYPLAGLSSLAGQAGGGGGGIKSVQSFTEVGNNSATQDITISAVNMLQTILIPSSTSSTTIANYFPYAELINSTTVRFTAEGLISDKAKIHVEVIEFDDLIASIQRGTVNITDGNSTGDATITSVDTSKTFVNHLGYTNSVGSNDIRSADSMLYLQNSTTVRAERDLKNDTTTVSYEIVEFK